MLEQHFAENQQPKVNRVPLPETIRRETATDVPHVKREAQGMVPLPRFAPLYLSRGQLITAFTLPICGALILAVLQWMIALLPDGPSRAENSALLNVAAATLMPWLLCSWTGYRLRNRRIATVTGLFVGMVFYLATRLSFRLVTLYPVVPLLDQSGVPVSYGKRMIFRGSPLSVEELTYSLIFCFLITFGAAAISQIKHGRRAMYDKASNR